METGTHVYAGISGVHLGVESFDLGEGVSLARTYAHLISPFIVAFAPPPGPKEPHPAPWSKAEGGRGIDVHVQLSVPADHSLGGRADATDAVWWLAALLRIAQAPNLSVPILSSHPFADVPGTKEEVRLRSIEVTPRILRRAAGEITTIDGETLEWVRGRWGPAGRLLHSHGAFGSAFRAFDAATVAGKTSSSLLTLWGALEQLFGFGRYRVASAIAAYLEPPGQERLATYRHVLKLYDARSAAAHTARDAEMEPLIATYGLMRDALVRMVDEGRVPTQADLEELLFGVADPRARS